MKSFRKLILGASTAIMLASIPVSAARADDFGGGVGWFAIIADFFANFQGQIDPFQGQIDPF